MNRERACFTILFLGDLSSLSLHARPFEKFNLNWVIICIASSSSFLFVSITFGIRPDCKYKIKSNILYCISSVFAYRFLIKLTLATYSLYFFCNSGEKADKVSSENWISLFVPDGMIPVMALLIISSPPSIMKQFFMLPSGEIVISSERLSVLICIVVSLPIPAIFVLWQSWQTPLMIWRLLQFVQYWASYTLTVFSTMPSSFLFTATSKMQPISSAISEKQEIMSLLEKLYVRCTCLSVSSTLPTL